MAEPKPPGCLWFFAKLVGAYVPDPRQTKPDVLPYEKKRYLLTKAERSFFGVLSLVAADQYWIFVKVRLADLVWMPKGTEKRQAHFNRVQSKHIDFVLCDRQAVSPVLAIELDDASHQRKDRVVRDEFLDRALKEAGLPLLHVPVRQTYAANRLRERIAACIAGEDEASGAGDASGRS